MPIVVRDVLMAYAAGQQGLPAWTEPPAARYRDYIAWLRRQDHDRAEAFWRGTLAGIKAPTLVAGAARVTDDDRPESPRAESPHAETPHAESSRDVRRAELPASLIDALQRLGAVHGITMNSWFAGVWALLLAHCTRQDDVVFGAVVSGRPPDLAGVEGIAGLFINTLPFRLRVAPRMPAIAWFAECQRRQLEAREYEYTSLARIQSWSALPKGSPLFDTIFVFENYPVEQVWRQQTALRLDEANAVAPTSYPIEVEVAGMASGTVVSIAVDPDRVGAALARFLVEGFERTLSRLAAAADERRDQTSDQTSDQTADQTIGALLDSLDELTVEADATQSRRHSLRQASLRALKSVAAGATQSGISS
jgi:non-ribosomal peptide synthetase component F